MMLKKIFIKIIKIKKKYSQIKNNKESNNNCQILKKLSKIINNRTLLNKINKKVINILNLKKINQTLKKFHKIINSKMLKFKQIQKLNELKIIFEFK